VRFRFSLSALCAFAAMALIGCSGTLTSQHGYVLATYTADGLAALPSDDPLYEAFDRDVMADPIVQHLLSLFDDTCGGFAATNLTSPNSQTLRNYLVVVTGGHSNRLLKDVEIQNDGQTVRVEYAVALDLDSQAGLAEARHRLPGLLGQFLLALTGQEPPAVLADAPRDCVCVSERMALWQGYAVLQRERLALGLDPSRDVASNGDGLPPTFDPDVWGCCAADLSGDSSSDCVCGRGVAGFLAELLAAMPASYPQHYMLWFANYEPGETRDAKLLLAFARMPRGDAGDLEAFVASYADTFPAEAELVRDLALTWRAHMRGTKP